MDGLPIARIAGLEIRVSLTWVFLLAIVTVLGAQAAAAASDALAPPIEWMIGGATAFAFLATVIAHELAHALVARSHGLAVTTLVIGFLGGTTPFDLQGRTAREEIEIGLAGPLLSLALGAVLVVSSGMLDGDGIAGALSGGVLVVGVLNLVLGGLSLLPAMPLDGGRLVRAVSWAHSGDPRRGSRASALIGRVTGWVLIAAGAALALAIGPAEGLMVMSLGWLVTTGAGAVERRLALETLLEGVVVRDAMERDVPRVPPHLTLDTFADRFAGTRNDPGATTIPVVDGERVVGVIAADRVRRLGRRRWATTRADEVMADLSRVPILDAGAALWDGLESLRRAGLDGLPVTDGPVFEGVLTRRSATNLIRERMRHQAGSAA
ncbi:MAG TPA: site-2 protease family protein [Candidatus Limnocylindrales bacterium]|nr:site-2 protease family protein [Candidatus Limnocylindrales bacterium]